MPNVMVWLILSSWLVLVYLRIHGNTPCLSYMMANTKKKAIIYLIELLGSCFYTEIHNLDKWK